MDQRAIGQMHKDVKIIIAASRASWAGSACRSTPCARLLPLVAWRFYFVRQSRTPYTMINQKKGAEPS
jgi:hypothetical protein